METSSAYDVLILPILQCFAGVFATFPILHAVRVGIGRIFGEPAEPASNRVAR